jgi:hypothetical protein
MILVIQRNQTLFERRNTMKNIKTWQIAVISVILVILYFIYKPSDPPKKYTDAEAREIQKIAKSKNTKDKLSAIKIARGYKTAPVCSVVAELLGDSEAEVANSAMRFMIDAGEPAVEPLIQSLYSSNKDRVINAGTCLVAIGEPSADKLVRALAVADDDKQWRVQAVVLKLGESARGALEAASKDKNPKLAIPAQITLIKLEEEREAKKAPPKGSI